MTMKKTSEFLSGEKTSPERPFLKPFFRALYDYTSHESDEISFQAGDTLWKLTNEDEQGMFIKKSLASVNRLTDRFLFADSSSGQVFSGLFFQTGQD